MESFTFGDGAGVNKAIHNMTTDENGTKYAMELNPSDLRTVLNSLLWSHESNGYSSGLAGDLLSSILSTLGVEYI